MVPTSLKKRLFVEMWSRLPVMPSSALPPTAKEVNSYTCKKTHPHT